MSVKQDNKDDEEKNSITQSVYIQGKKYWKRFRNFQFLQLLILPF